MRALFLFLVLVPFLAQAEDLWPGYKLLRQDEDFSYLRDPGKRSDYLDGIKFISLNKDKSSFLTLGGEVRERYEYFSNFLWGAPLNEGDGYILSRVMVHGDLHLNEKFRLFTQFKSNLVFDKTLPPRGIDKDKLDLHQLFIDGDFDHFHLRLGRQEINYGSGRLISVREGPNVRQSFDAVKLKYKDQNLDIDGLYSHPVETNPEEFDDKSGTDRVLFGVYANLIKLKADVYYLGYDRQEAEFDSGTDHEMRHSVGTRWFNKGKNWDYDYEGVYQFGQFGNKSIKAWTVSSTTGYTFNHPWKPRLELKASVASGDDNPNDDTLGTFNALFPKGAFFNEAAILGPANFMDIHPGFSIDPSDVLTFKVDWDFLWRQSVEDGLYNVPLNPIVPGSAGDSRWIGSQMAVSGQYKLGKHWLLFAQYVHFFAGSFLQEATPGKDIDYFTTWVTYKF